MTPEDITALDVAKFLGGIAVVVIGFFMRREIDKVGADLASKADKEHMQREIEGLKMELKETRDRRDADIERMERASAEKFAEFTASVRDRLSVMERNVDSKLDMISSAMGDKLDTVVRLIDGLRKE